MLNETHCTVYTALGIPGIRYILCTQGTHGTSGTQLSKIHFMIQKKYM